jgi:hypothetical protein
LGKCLALSLLAHLLLAGYAATVQVVHSTMQIIQEHRVKITDVEGLASAESDRVENAPEAASPKPWDVVASEPIRQADAPQPDAQEPIPLETAEQTPSTMALSRESLVPSRPDDAQAAPTDSESLVQSAPVETPQPAELATAPDVAQPQREQEQTPDPPNQPSPDQPHSPIAVAPDPAAVAETPASDDSSNISDLFDDAHSRLVDIQSMLQSAGQNRPDSAADTPPPPILPDEVEPTTIDTSGAEVAKQWNRADLNPASDPAPPAQIPDAYAQRMSDRLQMALAHGGSRETEAAVNAALAWLARHQNADGRWDANRHGAGKEERVGGEDRRGAGAGADTGVTGLALLAMLGAGSTQLQGEHQSSVRRGLEFLMSQQAADGNLAGQATLFSRMYCHAMATIALGEAYGLTADERLREPLTRAVRYTLKAQHPGTGGWRYQPSEPGDTSQLGWQLMALRSAELAGIPIPPTAKEGMARFLRSVASGTRAGLASYRPNEQATRSMTAEALVCRLFLGTPTDHPANREAVEFISKELPGGGKSNLYYWYYATLGLYQCQGEQWQTWNSALKSTLLAAQRRDGDMAGSWDTTDLWGGHGGRVYTTAVATLCLEVYYRYLPLYGHRIARPDSSPLR